MAYMFAVTVTILREIVGDRTRDILPVLTDLGILAELSRGEAMEMVRELSLDARRRLLEEAGLYFKFYRDRVELLLEVCNERLELLSDDPIFTTDPTRAITLQWNAVELLRARETLYRLVCVVRLLNRRVRWCDTDQLDAQLVASAGQWRGMYSRARELAQDLYRAWDHDDLPAGRFWFAVIPEPADECDGRDEHDWGVVEEAIIEAIGGEERLDELASARPDESDMLLYDSGTPMKGAGYMVCDGDGVERLKLFGDVAKELFATPRGRKLVDYLGGRLDLSAFRLSSDERARVFRRRPPKVGG